MSDKISDERLAQLEASLQEVGDAFGWASVSEQLELVRIARRSAEVKQVKPPSTKCIGWVKEAIQEHDVKWMEAIKTAGGTIEEEQN